MRIAVVSKYSFYGNLIAEALNHSRPEIVVIQSEDLKFLEGVEYFDYVFFPHFSRMIPAELLSRCKCIGFHIGNLPTDKGGSPVQNKIIRGEYQTFVNALILNDKIDGGDVIASSPINLEFGNIEDILTQAAKLISDLVLDIVTSDKLVTSKQTEAPVRFKRLSLEHSELDGNETTLKMMYDRIRMVDGLDYPKAFLKLGNFRIEFSNAFIGEDVLTGDCVITRV